MLKSYNANTNIKKLLCQYKLLTCCNVNIKC